MNTPASPGLASRVSRLLSLLSPAEAFFQCRAIRVPEEPTVTLIPVGYLFRLSLALIFKSRRRDSAPDQIDDGFVADQRTPAPVLGDEGEHPVFDLVPLAGSGER